MVSGIVKMKIKHGRNAETKGENVQELCKNVHTRVWQTQRMC